MMCYCRPATLLAPLLVGRRRWPILSSPLKSLALVLVRVQIICDSTGPPLKLAGLPCLLGQSAGQPAGLI